jgi:hypothetical protein
MEDCQSLHDISRDEFWHSLIYAMASIPKLYCVDALDEIDISKLGFLDRMVELGKQKRSTVKVLMTSRPLTRIESKLRTPFILEISTLQIRLQQNKVLQSMSTIACGSTTTSEGRMMCEKLSGTRSAQKGKARFFTLD